MFISHSHPYTSINPVNDPTSLRSPQACANPNLSHRCPPCSNQDTIVITTTTAVSHANTSPCLLRTHPLQPTYPGQLGAPLPQQTETHREPPPLLDPELPDPSFIEEEMEHTLHNQAHMLPPNIPLGRVIIPISEDLAFVSPAISFPHTNPTLWIPSARAHHQGRLMNCFERRDVTMCFGYCDIHFPSNQCASIDMHEGTRPKDPLHDPKAGCMLQVISGTTPFSTELLSTHPEPSNLSASDPTSTGLEDWDCTCNHPIQSSPNEDPYMEL